MIVAGNLREKITIRRYTIQRDEFGSEVETYTDYLTLRCEVKPVSGSKEINNLEIFNSKILKFVTYYRPISENDLVIYRSKEYRILNVTEIGFCEGLELTAELINK